MKNSGAAKHQPRCLLSHLFLNKLSVIIGSCDLLLEDEDASSKPDARTARRLEVMRSIARELASDVKEHQCALDNQMRLHMIDAVGTTFMDARPSGSALETGGQAVGGDINPPPKSRKAMAAGGIRRPGE